MMQRRPLFVCLVLFSAAACNAVTGEHDRFLEDPEAQNQRDTGPIDRPDTDPPIGDAGPADRVTPPADADAGPTTVSVPHAWTSMNGAQVDTAGGQTKFLACPPPKHHCMVIASPTPTTAKNYHVRARIRADAQSEFGILVRGRGVNNTFQAIVMSSRLSSTLTTPPSPNIPFLAPITVAADNPETGVRGQEYPYEAGKTWVFDIDVNGAQIEGKIFKEPELTLVSSMSFVDPTPEPARGSLIGFYGFQSPGSSPPNATLLELKITF